MTRSNRAMIVAPQNEAADAGAQMLLAGGNAVDAAIACALAQSVVDPLMCGIAGFGCMGIYLPQHNHHGYIDFHAPAPGKATPTMWEKLLISEARDGYGFLLEGAVNDVGYQSIGVPASLRAYEAAHRQFGQLPWAQLFEPAIAWADNGWTVRPHVHAFWSDEGSMGRVANRDRLAFTEGTRTLYCRPDGSPKQIGEQVRNRDYAQTLRLIANKGAEIFYTGELAQTIVEDISGHGGLLSLADLAGYQPVRSAPLWGSYRDVRVSSNQPPGGGAKLIEMLNILENFDLRGMRHNGAEYVAVVAEAMKLATIDKDRYIGDPAFVSVPLDHLTDKHYARSLAQEIMAGKIASVPRAGQAPIPKDTTHLSVVDSHGGCVTMTHTLGMPSGVITPGLGFMYNGCMGAFDPRPGRASSIAPGKSRFSAMCPSILFRDDRPFLVTGAPGGAHIAVAVMQTILNVIDFDMTMTEAVSAPRFSATSNVIDVSNRMPYSTTRELESRGYEVSRSPYPYVFAGVHSIRISGDVLDGAADPCRDGVALLVETP